MTLQHTNHDYVLCCASKGTRWNNWSHKRNNFSRKYLQEDPTNLPNMWFVGVINHFNHLVAGGFSNDVSSYLSSDRELMMYGVCFGIECEERFWWCLGSVNYLHSQQDKVSMVPILMRKHIVLLIIEIDVDIAKTISIVKKEFLDLKIIDGNLKPVIEIFWVVTTRIY